MTAWFLLASALAGLFSGVRTNVERVGPVLPAREKNCEVQFFEREAAPPPHEVAGRIQVWVKRNKVTRGRRAVYEDAEPAFQKEACQLGAHGVIVQQQTVSHSGEFKLLYVKGDAIRFTEKPSQ